MARSDVEVAVIGAGAAGIAAARRLSDAGADVLVLEARDRLGGRAWTVTDPSGGGALDLGCGWLHSGDQNPWTEIAETQGLAVDRSPAPWERPPLQASLPAEQQQDFQVAMNAFHDRLTELAAGGKDRPALEALAPGGRWNGLIWAIYTYVSGGELDRLSARDLVAYADTGANYRVAGGYGALIASHAAGLAVAFGRRVTRIDRRGRRIVLETDAGAMSCDQAIVTLPSALIGEEAIAFEPPLADKIDAARGLPLGLADKLFLSLEAAEEFPVDSRLFGRADTSRTGSYHLRPLGRPIVEAYFGGALAAELEAGGEAAFFGHAAAELGDALGSSLRARLKPLAGYGWRADPFARGSYSYALPGCAEARATLAEPVDDRLFFAGEACSRNDFSTAHGAYRTGVAAAEAILALRRKRG